MNIYKHHSDPYQLTEFKNRLTLVPELAFNHLKYTGGSNREACEEAIAKSAKYSYFYADDVLGGRRFILGEKIIATSYKFSYLYATGIICGRFELGEQIIKTNKRTHRAYNEYLAKCY